MYDVHGDDADTGGTPTNESEITAGDTGHNDDNGAEKNASPLLEQACAAIVPPSPSPMPDPSLSPDPGSTPDPSATPDPGATADPNGTPDPSATPDPNAITTPPDMPDTAVLGGPTGPTGSGTQVAALVGGLVALMIGLFAAARRPSRLSSRTPAVPSSPWSTSPVDRGGRRR